MTIQQRITELVDVVEHHPEHRGVLSTGERIAVSIVLRRMDWLLADGFEDLADACDRVGEQWLAACQLVIKQRSAARLRLVEE